MDIVTIEHSPHSEVLSQAASVVEFPLSASDLQLIEGMKDMVIKLRAMGLAAPQVGVAKQILVYHISEDAKMLRQDAKETVPLTVLLNARYSHTPDAKLVHDWEGCFSVKETSGKVPRYNKIIYTAQSPEGKLIQGTAVGFTARVLQHEIDHVHGILITHRLTADCVKGHPTKMQELRLKELTPEQKEIMMKMIEEREKNQQLLGTTPVKQL